MRSALWFVLVAGLVASGAMAQPADCPTRPSPSPSVPVTIDLASRPGMPAGVSGKLRAAVPMQAPQTECGEPAAPSDVLGGAPGDLLRGAPLPAQSGR
jgi:hypothetical protein